MSHTYHDEWEMEDYVADPLTTEEKIVLAHEKPLELDSWEILEVVQSALRELPPGFDVEQIDILFDVIHDAVVEAVERAGVRF